MADHHIFDELTKALARGASRRNILRLLGGMRASFLIRRSSSGQETSPASEKIAGQLTPMTHEITDRARAGRDPHLVFPAVILKDICIHRSAWYLRSDPAKKDVWYIWAACRKNSDGSCPEEPECGYQGRKLGFSSGIFSVSDPTGQLNQGVDKYGRKIFPFPSNPGAKNGAAVFSTFLANGDRFNLCLWAFWPESATKAYKSASDPKVNIVACSPHESAYLDKEGKPVIETKSGKEYKIPTCPGLLQCIKEEIPGIQLAKSTAISKIPLYSYPRLDVR